jgi:hypothetical protein
MRAGIRSHCSDWLHVGQLRVGVWVPVWARVFLSPCHPDWLWGWPTLLSNRYWRVFPWGLSSQCVKLTTHLQLEPRSRKRESILPLPHGIVLNWLSTGTSLPFSYQDIRNMVLLVLEKTCLYFVSTPSTCQFKSSFYMILLSGNSFPTWAVNRNFKSNNNSWTYMFNENTVSEFQGFSYVWRFHRG